ncbi:MAG: murein biosynthesis integral membrane protein MurJ, partial [Candidatus Rokubacteria bacterium]|nr:murein biosynthesis integral membrane protein MurJ [Candidatus Rokubacteria bacterium]
MVLARVEPWTATQIAAYNGYPVDVAAIDETVENEILSAVGGRHGGYEVVSKDKVSPVIGSELRLNALKAVGLATVGMIVYLTIRFEIRFAVAAIVLAPWIARLYAIEATGGTREAQLEVMTFLIRCFAPQIVFYGFTALATALLNAQRRFVAAAFAPVCNNIVVITTLLAFTQVAEGPRESWEDVATIRGDAGMLALLGIGTTAGIAAMALVLVPAVAHTGTRLRFVLEWRNAAVVRVVRLSGWTVGYVVANQLTLLFVLVLATTGESGDVSAYQYAFMFFQLPHGLFAVSIMTAVTPELSSHAAAGARAEFRDEFGRGLRLLLLVSLPSAAALAVLAQPAVAVLVRGPFDASDAAVTADVLQAFALGLAPFSVYLFALRAFYAHQDTRTPFFLNCFENAVNVVAALALFPALGVRGLALAYAVAYLVAAGATLAVVGRRFGGIGPGVGGAFLRAAAGAAALACLIYTY